MNNNDWYQPPYSAGTGNNNGFSGTPAIREPERFSRFEMLMAWCFILTGYLFMRLLPVYTHALGAMLFVILAYVLAFVWIKKSGTRPGRIPLLLAALALAFSPGFIFSSDEGVRLWLFFIEAGVYVYFVYRSFGNQNEEGIGRWFWFDAFKAAIIMPFSSFDALFRASIPDKKGGTHRKVIANVMWIIVGLLAAVIPTVVVTALLSFDNSFTQLLDRVFDFDISWISGHIFSIIFGIPAGAYIFGLFISSKLKKRSELLDAASCDKINSGMRFLPTLLSCTALTPVLIVYVLFFVSQWDMYISAFTGVLPEGMIYSDYARQGFFELCAVAGLNALMLICVNAFTKRATRAADVALRVLKTVTAVFTLVLIATALSKMLLYIGAYGLTKKRIFASWLMLFLAVAFIFVIIGQLCRRFRFNAALLIAFAVLFAGITLCDTGEIIASYNTEAYLSGSLDGIDLGELEELGDAGIPSLIRLAKEAEKESIRGLAINKIENYIDKSNEREDNIFTFNVPRTKALALLEHEGYFNGK